MSNITVSIVSHGHGALLDHVLRDLSRQTACERLSIVLTLNLANEFFNSADYPTLKIVIIRNAIPRGFGENHNSAFAICSDDWFLIVNPDVRLPDPATIEHLIAPFSLALTDSVQSLGIVAPTIVNALGEREDSIRSNLSPWSLFGRMVTRYRKGLSVSHTELGKPFFWVAGMFIAITSNSFRAVGGFDERFFLYCEDYDLSARIYLSGYSINVRDDVQVIHDAQRDSHSSLPHLQWHIMSLIRVWLSMPFWRLVFKGWA